MFGITLIQPVLSKIRNKIKVSPDVDVFVKLFCKPRIKLERYIKLWKSNVRPTCNKTSNKTILEGELVTYFHSIKDIFNIVLDDEGILLICCLSLRHLF